MLKKYAKRIHIAWRVLRGKTGVMTVSATLIHADGSEEDLGILSKGQVDMKAASGGGGGK